MSAAQHDRELSGLTWCLRISVVATLCGLSWQRLLRLESPAPILDTLAVPLWLVTLSLLTALTPLWPQRWTLSVRRTVAVIWFRLWLAAAFALLLAQSLRAAVTASTVSGWLLPLEQAAAFVAPLLLWFLLSTSPSRRPSLSIHWRVLKIVIVITVVAMALRALLPRPFAGDVAEMTTTLNAPLLDRWRDVAQDILLATAAILSPLIYLLRSRLVPLGLALAAAGQILLSAPWNDPSRLAAQLLSAAAAIVMPISLITMLNARQSHDRSRAANPWKRWCERGWRSTAATAAVAAMIVMAMRISALQGLLRPIRTSSGSMAPTMLGPHIQANCEQCRYGFVFDAVSAANPSRIVCPNCGFLHEQPSDVWQQQPGERVLIDHASFRHAAPQRWELVAVRGSDDPLDLEGKRIVGLPHETVAIEQGEVLIDGRLLQKSLSEFRELAVPVHDSAYQPPAAIGLPPRWTRDATASQTLLTYHHWRCYDSPHPRVAEAPVVDNDSYNQYLSRSLHRVNDLLLTADLTIEGQGQLLFHYQNGTHACELEVDLPSLRTRLLHEQGTIKTETAHKSSSALPTRCRWEFAIVDGRAMLAIDGQLLIVGILPKPIGGTIVDRLRLDATQPPLAISWRDGLHVQARRLRIARDVYYLHPREQNEEFRIAEPLAAGQYFLLGDNSPISVDSRRRPPVDRERILGRVVRFR